MKCFGSYIVPDPCEATSDPCNNRGTCLRTGLDEFNCTCQDPWSGDTCTGKNVLGENPSKSLHSVKHLLQNAQKFV